VDIALDHFHHDPSYQVRGAAVGAIAKAADPAQRQAVLTEAMATESYQDAIRNSAYQTIARSADTTFLDAVNARVAVDENAVYVLAGLGRRGSTRALDVLASHLNDEKRYVRDWALNAFRNAVPAALALPRLRRRRLRFRTRRPRPAWPRRSRIWKSDYFLGGLSLVT
jgi:HEAT repeat protein